MIVDHVGIVVRELDGGIAAWENTLGYTRISQPVVNTRQRVRVVFLKKEGSPLVKLVEPTDAASPVFAFAARGGGLHHLCFRVDNIERTLKHIERCGGKVISPPEPGEAFENEPIAFAFVQGLLAEIIATDKKAMMIVDAKHKT